tara:strand:- start:244 stop:480 length:237 start_codon:yes stop_codon:yes gene_type:complete
MDIEQLAKQMRERALLLEANPKYKAEELNGKFLEQAKRTQLKRVEELKKLYFNAGRWAGGSRDHTAREAFEKINGVLK